MIAELRPICKLLILSENPKDLLHLLRVGEYASLISINDFAKTTYGTLGLGQKKLFQEMRFNGILSIQNRPYQCYLNREYFEVITRVINGRVIYQPMLTGKGEVWLFKKMRKILGI